MTWATAVNATARMTHSSVEKLGSTASTRSRRVPKVRQTHERTGVEAIGATVAAGTCRP